MAIILAGGFIQDAVTNLKERYIHEFIGHLRVYQAGFLENGALHPYDYMISNPEAVSRIIEKNNHVLYVAPRIGFAALLSDGDSTISLLTEGIDPSIETSERGATHLEAGASLQDRDGFQILVGKGLAKSLGIKPGDSVVLVANTKRGAINASDLSVQGIFGTADKSYDDHTARVPLTMAQKLLRTEDVQALIVMLDRTDETTKAKVGLEKAFKRAGLPYVVKAWYELDEADFVLKAVAFYARLFLVLKIIIVLVVALSIVNTMNMAVLERIGEVGTMMAVGTRRSGVIKLFLIEGLFLGFFGGFLGCLGGIFLAQIISHFGISMPSPPGSTVKWVARIALSPDVCVFAMAMALITALFSSIVPAVKASTLDIGDALRHNV